jgi:hypothetical protein
MARRIDDTSVSLRWVVIVFVRENSHDIRFGAVVLEKLGKRASARLIELVAE